MKLQDLNKTIQSNLLSSNIIKNNLSTNLIILENNHQNPTGKLQSLQLENTPVANCWLFEHEDSEEELRAHGSKVEKTILLLSETKQELLIILLEMKSGFTIRELLACQKKLNCSLSHLSIFLATNNHLLERYNDYNIKFRFAIYCNNENIDRNHPLISDNLCQSFLDYRNGNINQFKIEINSPSLGFNIVPAVCIHKNAQEHISMNFNDLLTMLN